jgi:hypothetical protein
MIRRSKNLRRLSPLHLLTKSDIQKRRRARTVESEIREIFDAGSANDWVGVEQA